MKILLAEIVDTTRDAGVETLYPPVQLAYLAGYALKRKPEWIIKIVRGGLNILQEVREFKPDIVGVSFVTQNAMEAARVVNLIHDEWPTLPVVAGGQHVSALPYWFFDATDGPVYVIEGPGEKPFYDLCRMLDISPERAFKYLKKIPGLAYQDGEMLTINPKDLTFQYDRFSMPSYHLLNIPRNDVQMFTSRGCPFTCSFCSSAAFWGKPIFYSAKYVVDQIEYLHKRMGIDHINIFDDIFTLKPERTFAIGEMLDKKGLIGKVKFSCLARASTMNAELAKMLKSLGVLNIAFGLEHGNDRVLKMIKGKSASVASNYKAVEIVKAEDINAVGSVIYGLPDETLEEAQDTVEMVKQLELSTGEAYLAIPLPGTALWNDAAAKWKVSEDMDFEKLRFAWGDDSVFIAERMSVDELKELKVIYQEIFNKGGK